MTEKLIKRFLLEKAVESGADIETFGEMKYINMLFEQFKKGEIKINEFEFEIWLENLRRNKRNFGWFLKTSGYLKTNDKVYEITDDEKISSINGICLRADKNLIISQSGEGCYEKPYDKKIDGNLVINGVYDNQLIYLSRLLNDSQNSFMIGYYGQSDSNYTKKVLEYYKKLRQFLPLLTSDNEVKVVEDNVFGGDKIYVLTYQTTPTLQQPFPIENRHSER